MKATESCPKCRSLKLLVVSEVATIDHANRTIATVPFRCALHVANPDAGFFGQPNPVVESTGFQAWVCAACGYTEWYANDVRALLAISEKSGQVHVIERKADGGPYREG